MHRLRNAGSALLLAGSLLLTLTGCESLSYYGQAVQGQIQLLNTRKSIDGLIANPQTETSLKVKLETVLALRKFAASELSLPVKKQYASYADLERKYVVWNVFAAPELSLEAKTWCYPMIGCASYRGYYSEQKANKYAHRLKMKGFDTYVAGIAAYSTLGWFNDPVLNTFVNRNEAELANLIFHELAHQQLYIKGDTQFNESFATAVAKEGVRRWMVQKNNARSYLDYETNQARQAQFIALVSRFRDRLQQLYNSSFSPVEKQKQKAQIVSELKSAHQQLKHDWGGISDYDHWFSKPVNNAQLNTVATYFDQVPALSKLLHINGGDLNRFYQICERLAALNLEERAQYLSAL